MHTPAVNLGQIPFQETDLRDNVDFIKREIQYEYVLGRTGTQEAQRVRLETDPQVTKALEVLPQAKALFQNARKSVASKQNLER